MESTIRAAARRLQDWFAISRSRPLPFRLSGIDVFDPCLAQRGITESTARTFGIDSSPDRVHEGPLVIPIHNEQADLITYVGRAIDSSGPGTGSQPACMKVHQAGYPCAVALMGSTLSARQEKLLEGHFQQLVLMLDGDRASISAPTSIGRGSHVSSL